MIGGATTAIGMMIGTATPPVAGTVTATDTSRAGAVPIML